MIDRLADALPRLEIDVPNGSDGRYDERWQATVRAFQRDVGIKDSGVVGALTCSALHRAISVSGQWGC
ncbi:peptidoglycan-binding domain-containing protein [Allokutzneria oryzae]|uniref:Peptidoglycan-binding protein n=1 Tax=Allokutzneria oryzae TaxID=1378989 RepID=A0ABV5ZVY6_9PSEU